MKTLIAIDSLKGSLSSLEAGESISEGIKRVYENCETLILPLADGGEGTVEALVSQMKGHLKSVSVTGPLGDKINCQYGIIEKSKTAIIEMSGAAGITLVPIKDRNPMNTTTYGVGEVIKDAIGNGCRHFIVGIGGSATNDGGVGMLQALGFGFLNEDGRQIPFGAKGLSELKTITDEFVIPQLKECSFRVACDVTNILCGETGCSAVFGPQKGADAEMIVKMDKWLAEYAALTKKKYADADDKLAGSGAAGGLGFAFVAYMNAVLESGIDIVLDEIKLEDKIKDADFVITGEGRLDYQSVMGKAPIGVAKMAKKYGKTVIAFAGSVSKDAVKCNANGIDAYFPMLRSVVTLEEAMDKDTARSNLSDSTEQVFRLIKSINDKE